MNRFICTALLAAAFAFAGSANAAVIDFEDLGVAPGTQLQTLDGSTTLTGGFNVDSGNLHIHFHNQDGFGNNGTTNAGVHGFLNIADVGGAPFALSSFDFEYFTTDLGSITVNAVLSGGGNTSQVFATDGIPNLFNGASTYQTFNLNPTFGSIVSATITSNQPNIASINGFFIDNVNVNPSVPEPSTLLLLGVGLAGLATLGRRRT